MIHLFVSCVRMSLNGRFVVCTREITISKKSLVGLVIGLSGGFFGGLVGLGGGVIMIPMMTAFAGLTQREAHGTSLVAVVFTGAVGALTYFAHGVVDWKAAVILAASAILFARMGAIYAHAMQEERLKRGFGVFIICMSLLLVIKGWLPGAGEGMTFWPKALVLLFTGVGTGFISGMMGVGGGSVMIPAMVILAGMPQHLAQGTSLLAMVPVGITGAITHYRLGNVHVCLVLGLTLGATAGSFLGGSVAVLVPDFYLKLIFAAIGVWMGVRYVRA
jgi:uncharacterized membrane protein YfcA